MSFFSIKNLSISFANHQVLSNFSLQLNPKKITALVGPSGSGKSVLSLAIIGLLRGAKISGEILWTPQQVRGDKQQVRGDKQQVRGDKQQVRGDNKNCHPALVAGSNIVSVSNLSVSYKKFSALSDIGFSLKSGENLGVIGESGSGKSTLALALSGLIPSSGEIKFFNKKTWQKNNFELRKEVQIIFQDPFSSLDPRMIIAEIISEGLLIHKMRLSQIPVSYHFQTRRALTNQGFRFFRKLICDMAIYFKIQNQA